MRIILDAGHGGLHPTTKQYVTPGKRSPKFDDGTVLYEGVNNRDNVNRIYEALKEKGYDVVKLVDTWRDIKLSERANKEHLLATKDSILISIHSDGFGNGRDWNEANGMGCFIYTNASTKSHKLADSLNNSFICHFDGICKNRGIKKRSFAILRNTLSPAVLLELGFHTNKRECELMQTEDFKEKLVKSIIEAIEEYKLKTK